MSALAVVVLTSYLTIATIAWGHFIAETLKARDYADAFILMLFGWIAALFWPPLAIALIVMKLEERK